VLEVPVFKRFIGDLVLRNHQVISGRGLRMVYLVRCDNSHLAECETYHLTPVYTKPAGTTIWETTYRIFRRG
jgi:hypothetical protein